MYPMNKKTRLLAVPALAIRAVAVAVASSPAPAGQDRTYSSALSTQQQPSASMIQQCTLIGPRKKTS
ncbi:hypothetical protein RCH21_001415 [Arthrobacter sp. PL16]|nr:hypothetical protein [Arthrobacter sp. PL16]